MRCGKADGTTSPGTRQCLAAYQRGESFSVAAAARAPIVAEIERLARHSSHSTLPWMLIVIADPSRSQLSAHQCHHRLLIWVRQRNVTPQELEQFRRAFHDRCDDIASGELRIDLARADDGRHS